MLFDYFIIIYVTVLTKWHVVSVHAGARLLCNLNNDSDRIRKNNGNNDINHLESVTDNKILIDFPRLDGRIVGGQPINITKAPHQVSLQLSNHICGGSIISSKWILTAAHCTNGRKASSLRIRIGSSETTKGGQLIRVSEVKQHKKFNYTNVDYDYSLLKLSKAIKFDETKQPVKLPSSNETFNDGMNCFVTGWGNTLNSSESHQWLRSTKVPIYNQMDCSLKYKQFGGITDRMICAGYSEGGKDACQGDSGGPLVSEDGILAGIVSWGFGCAKPNYPGVYARVTEAREWIRDICGV